MKRPKVIKVRLLLIAVVAATLSGPFLRAQTAPTGTVNGQISVVGGFLAGARVVLDSSGDATFTATATTDANGQFSVTNVPVGTIGVKIYDAQNNLLKTVSATLDTAGQVLSLNIQIP